MSEYAFFECTNLSCRLRFPLDTKRHQGDFCPRCGARLCKVSAELDHFSGEPDKLIPGRRISGVLDNIRSAFNVGGIFRTADGAGVKHLYLCGITPNPAGYPSMTKTALGAEKTLPWSAHANTLGVIENLQEKGFFLLALERTSDSTRIQEFPLDVIGQQPIALIIGHERAGVDPDLLKRCDAVIDLPMVGGKASINVAVAFGVAAYWLAFR
ncbi:MAG: RNA methyltransferase [Brevefilum sp.]